MYTITKQFHFSAAHQLHGLPDDHPCSRLHGHNYRVEVVLQAQTLNAVGFVLDFGELKALKTYLDTVLDHRNLNDVLPIQTSAENIARHLFEWCQDHWSETAAVRVWETDSCMAEYRDES